ncbi:MAG: hypothetical protein GF365_00770 [Candidatus Buchananbacteria bacterium]|nr:hypothetical protein [Candidatus Buchananbacteria bacterium]
MPDVNKKQEQPDNQETLNQPEKKEEAPARIEVEKKVEAEKPGETVEVKEIEEEKEVPSMTVPTTAEPIKPQAPSPALEKIEDILEEDLEEIYFKMTPEKQARFKQTGEVTASKIVTLLGETKIKVKKILELIKEWLKIIPGINKFFLEQEAKIKTDKILDIKEERKSVLPEDENKI